MALAFNKFEQKSMLDLEDNIANTTYTVGSLHCYMDKVANQFLICQIT
jgi:hypothetical protein